MKKDLKNKIYSIVKSNLEKKIPLYEILNNMDEELHTLAKENNFSKKVISEQKYLILKKYNPVKNEDIKQKVIKDYNLNEKLNSEEIELFIHKYQVDLCQYIILTSSLVMAIMYT